MTDSVEAAMFCDAMLKHLRTMPIPDADFYSIPVRFDWDKWSRPLSSHTTELLDLKSVADKGLSRHGIVRIRQQAERRDGENPNLVGLFLATMMWGYGTNYRDGLKHTATAMRDVALLDRTLRNARRALLRGCGSSPAHIRTAYEVLRPTEFPIVGLGGSFLTKILYFLGYDQMAAEEPRPLILDSRVCRGLMRHARPYEDCETIMEFSPKEEPFGYVQYCEWMHGWARALGIEPDRLEWFFFEEGARGRKKTTPAEKQSG